MQDKLFTKNVNFQNVYVAQMIVNGLFKFLLFQNKVNLSLKKIHKLVIKNDIFAQKLKCFVFVEKNIQVVNLDKFNMGALKSKL